MCSRCFFPGDAPPEPWLWEPIGRRWDDYASRLGLIGYDLDLERAMHDLEQLAEGSMRQREAAKATVEALASDLSRSFRPRPDRRPAGSRGERHSRTAGGHDRTDQRLEAVIGNATASANEATARDGLDRVLGIPEFDFASWPTPETLVDAICGHGRLRRRTGPTLRRARCARPHEHRPAVATAPCRN